MWRYFCGLSKSMKIAVMATCAVAVFFLGFFANGTWRGSAGSESFETRSSFSGKYNLINPLLECNVGGNGASKYIPFESEAKERIQKRLSEDGDVKASVYFRNLNNGPWFGINEEDDFTPASLLKVPLMMAYLKLSESDSGLLDKKITYRSSADRSYVQAITSGSPLEDGKEYSIGDLIAQMIKYSDNEAMYALYRNIRAEDMAPIYTDLGIVVPSDSQPDNFMSVKEYASFFRILYNASYLDDKQSEYALDLLSQSAYKDGLVAGLPDGMLIAHKFGERALLDNSGSDVKQLHDCGIVYYPNYPYLLCVMTRGNDSGEMSSVIADVSRIVYDEVSKSIN